MWKPVQPPISVLQKCLEAFRREVGPITLCDEESGHKAVINYDDSRVRHIKTYRSKDGEYLASFQLDIALNKCAEVSDVFGVRWFIINKSGPARYIGKGMTLLDSGDYDNDGVSEVVFWRAGYNEDGYILFYNHFSDHIEFTWNYH